jgi:hypothetical protein
MVLRRDPALFDECVLADPGIACGDSGFRAGEETSVLDRRIVLDRAQTVTASGQLHADPLAPRSGQNPTSTSTSTSGEPAVTVATSSTRTLGLPGGAGGAAR